MYSNPNRDYVNNGKLIDKTELLDIEGFFMGSPKKVFKIEEAPIREIRISNKKLANPIVSKVVFKKYNELLQLLTGLLIDDDDSGDTFREALNQIEKFRIEIKNKYRAYLLKKELEKMAKELKILQKEAREKLYEIQYSYLEYQNESRKSR